MRGEKLDRLNVADHLGCDRARLLPGVIPHRQPLQLLIDPHPHVVQDLERGDVAEPTFQVTTHGHQCRCANHGEAEPDERAGRRRVRERGQHLPDDQGGQDAERRVQDRAKHRDREQAPMAARDRQHAGQKNHELAILFRFPSPPDGSDNFPSPSGWGHNFPSPSGWGHNFPSPAGWGHNFPSPSGGGQGGGASVTNGQATPRPPAAPPGHAALAPGVGRHSASGCAGARCRAHRPSPSPRCRCRSRSRDGRR